MNFSLTALIVCLISAESGGDDNAYNAKEKAVGCLQVRAAVVQDVNKHFGTTYTLKDMYNRDMAISVCGMYIAMYATPERLDREPTAEDCARIWNGGPNGWLKDETIPYWNKVYKKFVVISP